MSSELGRVLWASQGGFEVDLGGEVVFCQVKGRTAWKRGREGKPVAVGDEVSVERNPDGTGVIVDRVKRRSVLSRTDIRRPGYEQVIVANVDQLVIVASAADPPLREHMIDRFIVAAHKGKLDPIVCINKIDLVDPVEILPRLQVYERLGYPVVVTSVELPYGLDDLRGALSGKASVLAGQSGTGKSSLLNALDPTLDLRVGEVVRRTRKGGHTTTSARLFGLGGRTYIADTPGVREMQLWDLLPEEVNRYFVEFQGLSDGCYFRSCQHREEPNCAVRDAVEDGRIAPGRYESYLRLMDTLGDTTRR